MNKKYTVLISANANESTKSFSVSQSKFRILLCLGLLVSGLLVAFLTDYFQLLYRSTRSQQLQVENAVYKQKFSELEGKLEKLEQSLNRVENFSARLRVLADLQPNTKRENVKKNKPKDWSFFPKKKVCFYP